MGFSPKARRYVSADVHKVTKRTASISARAADTKRTQERYGFPTRELATEARRAGALQYTSADQRERVAKAARTRVVTRVKKAVGRREAVPTNSPNKRRHGRIVTLRQGDADRYRDLKRRRLAGETLPIGDWVWLMDVGQFYGDPDVDFMRGSPSSFGFGFVA
jgi:hypothetical protein